MTRNIILAAMTVILAAWVTRLARSARNRVPLPTMDDAAPDPCDVRLARLSAEATMLRGAGR